MLITLHILKSQEKKLYDSESYKTWQSLTEDEKYESYIVILNAFTMLQKLYKDSIAREETIMADLEYTNNFLEKKYYPKFGINANVYAGLTQELRADCFTTLNFNIYFLQGRFYFSPNVYFKFFDKLGGGIGIGLGFNF